MKKRQTATVLLLLLFTVLSGNIFANDIKVENVAVRTGSATDDYTLIEFDLSWSNSWRTDVGPSNWDAAWVFVKFRNIDGGDWQHAVLNYTDGTGTGDGHTEPANCEISSADDNTGTSNGVFIYRDANLLQGNVAYNDIKLRWNYGDNGLADCDSVEVAVFAIEMVYVPQGSFELGSGGTETSHFFKYNTSTSTYTISSEAGFTTGTTTNALHNVGSTYTAVMPNGTLPAAFPKGYDAFYCMKYKISQGQYADFLNKLTTTQQATRAYTGASNRHSITETAGVYTASKPFVAKNYLSWADLAAYLDWAALRPFTELEFEKACRGTAAAVANEYAWGSTAIAGAAYTINNDGAANEGIATNYSTTAGNASYNTTDGSINGPLRCGIFARAASTRIEAGATFYGIMEMSGNLWERPITVGNATGRAFTGVLGNGTLDATGNANVANWPGTGATGVGFRGGSWNGGVSYCRSSDRSHAAFTNSGRSYGYGGRGARLAP